MIEIAVISLLAGIAVGFYLCIIVKNWIDGNTK